jgi:hypothetical protein
MREEREREGSLFLLEEIFYWIEWIIDWLMFVFLFTPSRFQGAALNC